MRETIKFETKLAENAAKEVFNKINAARTVINPKLKLDEAKLTTSNVGGNGNTPGTQFTLTGKIKYDVPVTDSKGKVTNVYEGFETLEGEYISVGQVMGISSKKGFSDTEAVEHYSRPEAKEESTPIITKVTPEVIEGFDFDSMCPALPTRNKYEYIAYVEANPTMFANKTIEFLGTMVRQLHARKNGHDTFNTNDCFIVGDPRAQTAKLWRIL